MSTFSIFITLILVVCFLLILVVMVQNPKGGGLSSSFGGGGGQQAIEFRGPCRPHRCAGGWRELLGAGGLTPRGRRVMNSCCCLSLACDFK